jgi:hypothetical protein
MTHRVDHGDRGSQERIRTVTLAEATPEDYSLTVGRAKSSR